jgi:hypothetical protein
VILRLSIVLLSDVLDQLNTVSCSGRCHTCIQTLTIQVQDISMYESEMSIVSSQTVIF